MGGSVRNRVKCLLCGEIIESKDRHDFVWCSCGNVAVDGGPEYKRRVFRGEVAYEEIEDEENDDGKK